MKLERSKVEFPLWRKKVDSSLFEYKGTTIPTWACTMWRIQDIYFKVPSKKKKESEVDIYFLGRKYQGYVTIAKEGRKTPAYRLWFCDDLCLELKQNFLMSYMRALENKLRPEKKFDIEKEIPFWEFLDIEFDGVKRQFKFQAYYYQEPSFPELFKRLIGSPRLKQIDDELYGKGIGRIYKQSWRPKEQLEFELGAQNVIYWLIDTVDKLLYIGEAQDLVKRLSQGYPSIPNWSYYRYDVLPQRLEKYRVTLERMTIRGFAEILDNKSNIDGFRISEYKLANDKIDTK
jgi:hypothetical protein